MYKVDINGKKLIRLSSTRFETLNLKERYDIEEWIEKTPEILGEELLIIGKELRLSSGIRLDLLAVDKKANLVIIELKRDDSGSGVEWQAVKYTSYCSNFLPDDIFKYYAEYLETDEYGAKSKIEEFIAEEIDELNKKQRIILVSREFRSDVISAVLWLRDYEIDIECIKLKPHLDPENESLFVTSDLIIPLPEAKDYIQKKVTKQKESKRSGRSSFSLEKSHLPDGELRDRLINTLQRQTRLTPRLIVFLDIISSEERVFEREDIKSELFKMGVGENIGQCGRYLSGISQFLTKESNSHLRQVIDFGSDNGALGERKNNYRVVPQYYELLRSVLKMVKSNIENEEN
ncbi:hypothetical protein DRH14_00035 [Candidatus Shapirobacteria bacterium]|nr:MAG: hypothetical protein DRH14_00035 [Candidatus Shapirobacteria bacterium]